MPAKVWTGWLQQLGGMLLAAVVQECLSFASLNSRMSLVLLTFLEDCGGKCSVVFE